MPQWPVGGLWLGHMKGTRPKTPEAATLGPYDMHPLLVLGVVKGAVASTKQGQRTSGRLRLPQQQHARQALRPCQARESVREQHAVADRGRVQQPLADVGAHLLTSAALPPQPSCWSERRSAPFEEGSFLAGN